MMKRRFFAILPLVIMLLGATACSTDTSALIPDSLTLVYTSSATLSFAADDSSARKASFHSSEAWHVETEEEWVEVSPMSGPAGDGSISVKVAVNRSYSVRRTTVTIVCGTATQPIVVQQLAFQDKLALEDTADANRRLPYTGEGYAIRFTANNDWWIENDNDWFDVTPETGDGESDGTDREAEIWVETQENSGKATRTGSFKICAGRTSLIVQVTQDAPEPEEYEDGYSVRLATHTKGNGVKLIILGDGYTAGEELRKNGKFECDVEAAVEAFFAIEPYTTLRPYFDVYMIVTVSNESGATIESQDITRDTALSSVIEGGNSTGIGCDYSAVFEYGTSRTGIITTNEELRNTAFLVLINEDIYAGTCAMYYDPSGRQCSISMVPVCSEATYPVGRIIRHECGGHGWGGLADEYRYYRKTIPDDEKQGRQAWMNAGYFVNITFESRENAPWADYFTRDGYDMVGYYEGGMLYYYGVWRPEEISCMEDNREYFNAPSRERIYRRTLEGAGETFDLDAFLQYDRINLSTLTLQSRTAVERPMPALGEPVLLRQTPSCGMSAPGGTAQR